MSIVSEITRIKRNVASAYGKCEEKGAMLPVLQSSDNLAETIGSIPQSVSGWKPEPDWLDIDRILQEDTEEYPSKIAVLLIAAEEVQHFPNLFGASKVRMSDGQIITASGDYTWDETKDKVCSLGYKTRYLIFYYDTDGSTNDIGINCSDLNGSSIFPTALYMIYYNCKKIRYSNGSPFSNLRFLECVKTNVDLMFSSVHSQLFLNCSSLQRFVGKLTSYSELTGSGTGAFQNCFGMKNMDDFNFHFENAKNMRAVFTNTSIRDVDFAQWDINVNTINSLMSCFGNNVLTIKELNFESVTDVSYAFTSAINLYNIEKISNIKISGLDFSKCSRLNHDTLMRILNALCDFSEDTENTYTITFGSTNLAKLSEEEIAIGQDKGWTIS